MQDETRRRNEDERSAPLFKGGQAKRGSRAGSGGDGEGDEAALYGSVQAVSPFVHGLHLEILLVLRGSAEAKRLGVRNQ